MKKYRQIYLFLTLEQWLGLALLVILVMGTLLAVSHFQPEQEEPTAWANDSTKMLFTAHQTQQDSLRKAQWKKTYPRDTIEIRMQAFDPNTADSSTLVHVGFKPWQAKNLLKYRAKGGRYRQPDDLKKLYGMTDSMYQALTPYIHIAREEGQRHTDSVQQDSIPKWPLKKDTILNLRTADTTELKLLRGIGSYRARQIVNYRQQLGGFTHIEQVLEAKGMQHLPDSILQHFFIDTIIIEPIDINHASPQQLARHPYLRFEQAQAIYQLRKRKMHLDSIPQLLEITDFSAETLQKLAPYLKFDKN
jgi:competence ComEA-like helix-hairpin-helix protein